MQKKNLMLVTWVALALVLGLAGAAAGGTSIDYVATDISPAANFDGQSGNYTLINNVTGGTEIDFTLTFSIKTTGNSTANYPIENVTFGVINTTGPAVPMVYFGATGTATTYTATFANSSSTFSTQVRVTAPVADGSYSVKIKAKSGTGGQTGLSSGGGIVVAFTVANPSTAAVTSLSLTLDPSCVLYKATSTSFKATLTSANNPLPGKLINFTVDGDAAGSATTDGNGAATLTYDPSGLTVGDHTVVATFAAESAYQASIASATLGVNYKFLGFQPPVQIQGAGIGLFSGRVIPVKIKIADAFGNPVSDALAYVFFSQTSANVTYDMAEPLANTNGDSGNQMRYDALADQYIFNWDISKVANGSYTIKTYLGEGSCAGDRIATVAISKSGGGKK
jgi:hypothetical protein